MLNSDVMVMIMNSLPVVSCCIKSSKSLVVLFAALLVSTSGTVYAAEGSISKSEAPGPVLVLSNSDTSPGVGFSSFTIISSDFPQGTLIDPKQLLEVQWSTTYYPDSIRENVKLCYSRPFSSQEDCRTILPNSSGALSDFNVQSFDNGVRVRIYHEVYGGTPRYTRPAGIDRVTFRYKY